MDLFFSYLCPRMEEMGAAASKEYSLEKSMQKMKAEWRDLRFSFSQYRDTVRKAHTYYHMLHFYNRLLKCLNTVIVIFLSLLCRSCCRHCL